MGDEKNDYLLLIKLRKNWGDQHTWLVGSLVIQG